MPHPTDCIALDPSPTTLTPEEMKRLPNLPPDRSYDKLGAERYSWEIGFNRDTTHIAFPPPLAKCKYPGGKATETDCAVGPTIRALFRWAILKPEIMAALSRSQTLSWEEPVLVARPDCNPSHSVVIKAKNLGLEKELVWKEALLAIRCLFRRKFKITHLGCDIVQDVDRVTVIEEWLQDVASPSTMDDSTE
jgi:hypothetical protein